MCKLFIFTINAVYWPCFSVWWCLADHRELLSCRRCSGGILQCAVFTMMSLCLVVCGRSQGAGERAAVSAGAGRQPGRPLPAHRARPTPLRAGGSHQNLLPRQGLRQDRLLASQPPPEPSCLLPPAPLRSVAVTLLRMDRRPWRGSSLHTGHWAEELLWHWGDLTGLDLQLRETDWAFALDWSFGA